MANEKWLIDAGELLCDIHHYDKVQKNDVWHTSDIEALLAEQPTVNAVEVIHGRWLSVEDSLFPGTKEKCSLCGVHKGIGYVYHYCPNCGARMDGDGDA